ncbi:hypothetical protein ABZ865_19615 [Streptomyces sp. NPDC047085]|uniref:hypothetical protein n=1 Tax=Streptomyces sp. NPDC047085 TaxID=3155140 RepID=UPI0033CF3C2A
MSDTTKDQPVVKPDNTHITDATAGTEVKPLNTHITDAEAGADIKPLNTHITDAELAAGDGTATPDNTHITSEPA